MMLWKKRAKSLFDMAHIAESTHWYDKEGNPAYEVEAKKGGMRPTTLRDARVLDLVPSVTSGRSPNETRYADAALAGATPEGYALVPIEPTADMLIAAWNSAELGRSPSENITVWKAMLAASQIALPGSRLPD